MDSIDDHKYKKRPTQADVARLAEVSQAMVSYVVNNIPSISISAGTRARVLDAVKTLGYVPDSAARSLKTRKSSTVAGIIPDITNPFYPAFQRGIQDIAEARGYDLITCNTDGIADREHKFLRLAHQGRVDGFVAVFFHLTANDLQPLLERGIAIVRLEPGRKNVGRLPLDNIYVDNVAAARTATSYLIERGHRTIGMLAGQKGPQHARVRGYKQALAESGITLDNALIQGSGFQHDNGYQGMRELIDQSPRPTAVFAANDLLAMGALSALRDAGLRVPGDVAIVGVDDIPAAALINPPLTTISQFPHQLGRRAAEMLFERLEGNVPGGGRCELMPHELIVRESV
jgi:LacI family transcriptional regulator